MKVADLKKMAPGIHVMARKNKATEWEAATFVKWETWARGKTVAVLSFDSDPSTHWRRLCSDVKGAVEA